MRVWVTGIRGLLGSSLEKKLTQAGIPFVGSVRDQADVTDFASLEKFYQEEGPFTHLIHCAAYTQVDFAESFPEEAHRVNALSPALIGSLAKRYHFHVVHVSTDYVFDGQMERPLLESDLVNPQTVYGKTKAEGEANLLSVLPDACIIRTSWLFGMGGRNFVSSMIRLMQEKEEVRVVVDQKGRPTYAPDLAEVFVHALNWSGVYHVANQDATSWHAFAEEIYRIAVSVQPLRCRAIHPILSSEYPALAPRPLYSVLDTSKAEKKLGSPLRSWKDGLTEMIDALS